MIILRSTLHDVYATSQPHLISLSVCVGASKISLSQTRCGPVREQARAPSFLVIIYLRPCAATPSRMQLHALDAEKRTTYNTIESHRGKLHVFE